MLVQLSIRNLAIIERLDFHLGPGFNVLTGETGAGKSMVIDALSLVLGGRASADVVRRGAKEAEVSAVFEVAPNGVVARKLEAVGIACEGEVVIRRVVAAEGRSRAFVNGRPFSAAELHTLAADLCDISSQHESVRLTDPQTHGAFLDAFGALEPRAHELATRVRALQELQRQWSALQVAQRGRAEREDYLRFQIREIDELDPVEGEEHELAQRRNRLRHAERLTRSTRSAAEQLYDSEHALCDILCRVASDLAAAAELDPAIGAFAATLDGARVELTDAARALGRYADGVQGDPAQLAELEERLFRLQKLLRKHGPTTTELRAYWAQMQAELATLAHSDVRLGELAQERSTLLDAAAAYARALSLARRAQAERLGEAIGRELAQLGMGRARVLVDVGTVPGAPDGLQVDGLRLGASGLDRVEFLIAPNPGEEPKPLRKIASGGELSRSLLALKRVLAENGPAGLYVFDEVDAGVSGGVAEVIGHAIRDVARHRQVLCITHLPQIAALADTHFRVDKVERDARTTSAIVRLSPEERVGEIARMLGGVRISEAARHAAAELLGAHALPAPAALATAPAPASATVVATAKPAAPASRTRASGPGAARAKPARRARKVA